MPVIPNPRHEKFCQEIAKGKSAGEAYRLAGYDADEKSAETLGPRLFRKVQIASRVAELQEGGARRAEITVQSLLAEAEEARLLAIKIGQPAAAVAATRERGVLSGKRIEKSEQGKPGDFDRMADDELEEFIASRQGIAGAGASRAGKANGQTGVRGKPNGFH